MSAEFFIIDYRRATYGEFMTGGNHGLLMHVLVLLTKFSTSNVTGSTDDVPVQSLASFEVEAFPEDLQRHIAPLEAEIVAQGFHSPTRHRVVDPINKTMTGLVTYLHPSGILGRAHVRLWRPLRTDQVKIFAELISPLAGGGFLWTLSGGPDMLAPGNCVIQREVAATPATLLPLHKQRVGELKALAVQTMNARNLTIENLQRAVWDFHTGRGVFRRATAEEVAAVRRAAEIVAPKADGSLWQHPAVLHQIELQQNRRSSWKSGFWLLVISLGLFLVIGRGTWKWSDYLYLIPVLFFHELGHYVAMRTFGYKNLKMLFIPFLGAAVTGRNYNIAAWKQAVVFLMGPVPGIVVGIVLGLSALQQGSDLLFRVAMLLIVINGFNLLPLMPLDGGRVMHALLFSHHPAADVAFRIVAAAALIAGGFYLGKVLIFLGFLMLLGLPQLLRLARIRQELRRAGVGVPEGSGQAMPPELADAIAGKLVITFPRVRSPRVHAANALSIFEGLNARPPGWLGTIALLSVYGLAAAATIAFGMYFLSEVRARADMLRLVSGSPLHAAPADGVERTPPAGGAEPLGAHVSVIATLNDAASVRGLRESWQRLLSSATVATYGDTFAVTLTPNNASWGEAMLKTLRTSYENVYVEDALHDSRVSIKGAAANEADAAALVEELGEYFAVAGVDPAIAAPWSVGDGMTQDEYAGHRAARRTYAPIAGIMQDGFAPDPEVASPQTQIDAASNKDDRATLEGLSAEQESQRMKLRRQALEGLCADTSLDQDFLESYLAMPQANGHIPVLPALLVMRLGLLDQAGPTPASAALVDDGWVSHTGDIITLEVTLPNFTHGVPAIVQWLKDHRVTDIRYQPMGAVKREDSPAK